MLDPLTLLTMNDDIAGSENLRGLHLIAGFTGFAEAGRVVSQIGSELLDAGAGTIVASFDADQLLDYRSRRPVITFAEDHLRDYQPPRLELHLLRDGLGRPFLLLTGFEPDFQWERFVRAVVHLVEQLDVRQVTWIHSIPMPVPHTRPFGVTVHGNRPDLSADLSTWRPTGALQASVGHLLELRLTEAGRDVVGYVIHVPHYLADAEYPSAAVAALEYVGAATDLMLPADRLRDAGREMERQIAEQVGGSAEVQGVVSSLEKQYDEAAGKSARRSLLVRNDDEPVDADRLGAEVEAYLAGLPPEDPE